MLSRSILTVMIPVPLILFGLGAAFFIEYQKHLVGVASFGGEKLSPTEYVMQRVDVYRQQSEAQAAVSQFDLRATLPVAPEGWTRARYEVAHGEQITGTTFKSSMLVKDTEKSIQDDFRSVKKRQKDAVTASYIKGEEIISIRVRAVKPIDGSSLEGKLAKQLAAQTNGLKQEPDPVFTVAGDIEFRQLAQMSTHLISKETRPVRYRRFEGGIGKQLDIFVFSNAEDSAILDVIHGIDFASLKEFANVSKAIAARADPGLGGVDATPEQVQAAAAKALADAVAAASGLGDGQPNAPEINNSREAAAFARSILEQASAGIAAQEPEPQPQPQKTSFRDRLRGLLGGGDASGSAKEAPKKTVCSVDQGFKRCVFVEE